MPENCPVTSAVPARIGWREQENTALEKPMASQRQAKLRAAKDRGHLERGSGDVLDHPQLARLDKQPPRCTNQIPMLWPAIPDTLCRTVDLTGRRGMDCIKEMPEVGEVLQGIGTNAFKGVIRLWVQIDPQHIPACPVVAN